MKINNQPRVMIVDDMIANLNLLNVLLTENGYRTSVFPKAELAMKAIRKHPPDVILLDINMPGMNGFEMCQALHRTKNADIPVIFLTAMTDINAKVKAFSNGGVDYITKPFEVEEVLIRVKTHTMLRRQKIELEQRNLELIELEKSLEDKVKQRTAELAESNTELKASQEQLRLLNKNLERRVQERTQEIRKVNQQLFKSLRKLKDDEEAGHMLQFKLLPEPVRQIAGFRFSHYLKPSLYMSGDFVDYTSPDKQHIVFYAIDVSGHGSASAYITFLLKSFITSQVYNFCRGKDMTLLDPAAIMTQLNTTLLEEDLDKYITMFYGVIDLKKNIMHAVNAGHFPFPIFKSGNKVKVLSQKQPPAGMFEWAKYQNLSVKLPEEFDFIVFSDGALELMPPGKLEDQITRLTNIACKSGGNIDKIVGQLKSENVKEPLDDITILVMQRRKEYESE